MAFLFFWQSLHTFAHLLHTLQKSHVIFASLAQRVFRCTKKRILREEHPRQLAALLCVHLPDGFKDHFTRDFCCHRRFVFRGVPAASHLPHPACRSRLRSSRSTPTGVCPACGRRRNAFDQARIGTLGIKPKYITEVFVDKENAEMALHIVRTLPNQENF